MQLWDIQQIDNVAVRDNGGLEEDRRIVRHQHETLEILYNMEGILHVELSAILNRLYQRRSAGGDDAENDCLLIAEVYTLLGHLIRSFYTDICFAPISTAASRGI